MEQLLTIFCPYHENAGLFAIHEALRNGIGSEDFIPAERIWKKTNI